jgi:hypothetical protein
MNIIISIKQLPRPRIATLLVYDFKRSRFAGTKKKETKKLKGKKRDDCNKEADKA